MPGKKEFEWDDNKRRANVEKHGIDFVDAKEVFDDPEAITLKSPVHTGEPRYVTIGTMKGKLIAVITTLRDTTVRIISARVARRIERQTYDAKDKEGRKQ
jgi:uncharacterized DUF497 family protein